MTGRGKCYKLVAKESSILLKKEKKGSRGRGSNEQFYRRDYKEELSDWDDGAGVAPSAEEIGFPPQLP